MLNGVEGRGRVVNRQDLLMSYDGWLLVGRPKPQAQLNYLH